MNTTLESTLWQAGYAHVAGIDEAGRGALAGPVVAAAVILPQNHLIDGVNDSKKLSPSVRQRLFNIIHSDALSVSACMCSPAQIDSVNILQATLLAMYESAATLSISPDYVLIDGNRVFDNSPWPVKAIKGGDARCQSIAAASIIAKVTRDNIMKDMNLQHPEFGWNTNMGYPTPAHYAALGKHGPTVHHRKSFRLGV